MRAEGETCIRRLDMDRPQGWEGEHSRLEVFRSRCTEMIVGAVQVDKCRNWPKETIKYRCRTL